MKLDAASLFALGMRSMQSPREAADEILSLGVPRSALWPLLLLSAVLSGMLALVTNEVYGEEVLLDNGLLLATLELAALIITILAVAGFGRAFGGRGTFDETSLLIAWLQLVACGLQGLVIVALVIMPPLASLIMIARFVLYFWMLTNFVVALHGFRSAGLVFLSIIVIGTGIALVVLALALMMGVEFPGVQI